MVRVSYVIIPSIEEYEELDMNQMRSNRSDWVSILTEDVPEKYQSEILLGNKLEGFVSSGVLRSGTRRSHRDVLACKEEDTSCREKAKHEWKKEQFFIDVKLFDKAAVAEEYCETESCVQFFRSWIPRLKKTWYTFQMTRDRLQVNLRRENEFLKQVRQKCVSENCKRAMENAISARDAFVPVSATERIVNTYAKLCYS